jgi:glycosyltransferase involved in cell wall biosynthesis
MRILFLVCAVTAHDEKFIRSFSAGGYETRIFSFHQRKVDERLASLPHISLTAIPLRVLPRLQRFLPLHLLPRLKACIREFRPDIIHAGNTWNESFLGALSGFHPLLVLPYGSDVLIDTQRNFWFRFANTRVFKAADWVTCDAEHVKRKLIRDFNYPSERITIIPWGIDVEAIAGEKGRSRERVRSELGWQNNFVVIMTRNHEPVYGVDVFLKAMEIVVRDNRSVRVLLIGGGALTGQFRSFVRERGLEKSICFTGEMPHALLLQHLHAADLYVSSSYSDGTSVSLLEAMASGLSALLTDVPSNLEWVQSGVNGEIVPRGDHAALARQVLALARDPARNAAYGARNLAIVRERGDWKKNFAAIEDIYHTLMKGGRRSG